MVHAVEHHYAIRLDDKEDGIGKALEVGPANIFPNQWGTFRLPRNPIHHRLQAAGELGAKARAL